MSEPNSEEVNTSLTGDETHSQGSLEVEDVVTLPLVRVFLPFTSEETARQIKAATDPQPRNWKNALT